MDSNKLAILLVVQPNELQTKLVAAAEAALPNFDYRIFTSDGDMPTNNWKENPDGQSYLQRIRAEGRPDVLEWARAVLAPRIQRTFEEFSERYGWGNPGDLKFSQRDAGGAGGNEQPVALDSRPEQSLRGPSLQGRPQEVRVVVVKLFRTHQ